MRGTLLPDVAIQPRPPGPDTRPYVRSYVFMRLAIGVLGVALPLLLVLVEPILFDGLPFPRGSLSAYYYSGMRDVFVGVLWAIGVFLVTYKLTERSWESTLSTFAGVSVVVVAVFPTRRPGEGIGLTPLQDLLGESLVEGVHFVSAGAFIGSLAAISFLFGRDEARRSAHTGRSSQRATLHWTCAGIIVVALALAAVAGVTSWPDKGLLIAQVAAVLAFAASWLAKVELDILFGRR